MADDLISRSELRAAAIKATAILGHEPSEFSFDNCYPYWQFSNCIKEAHAVDAVPVVRCRECVHYSVTPACVWNGVHYPEEYHCLKILERYNEDSYSNFDNAVAPEDFCSSGERKEPD